MNQAPIHAWSTSAHNDPMVSAPEDDFTNFLDLGNFQLDFPAFDPAAHGEARVHHDDGHDVDTSMDDAGDVNGRKETHAPQTQQEQGRVRHSSSAPMMQHVQTPADAMMEMNMQAQLLHRQQQRMREQGFQRPSIIPPTPNSIEMHGGTANFYQQLDAQSQALMERYQRIKEDQMVFTPLVSPAVTPLESQFAVPEYTVPGAYFSPLTSPALEAQNHASQRPVYQHAPRSDTSVTTSPVDMSFDLNAMNGTSATSQPANARKSRRRMSTPRTPARVVRQSPSMKPQRRKTPSSTVVPPKELTELAEQTPQPPASSKKTPQQSAVLNVPYSRDSSGTESISPEPLSEILMAPPPAPRSGSAQRSPFIAAKNGGENGSNNDLHPATPASLMRLQKQSDRSQARGATSSPLSMPMSNEQRDDEQVMEDLTLPEAARSTHPPLARADSGKVEGEVTPTMSAKRTPKMKPLNTSGSVPISATQSPSLNGLGSPMSATTPKRTDTKGSARTSKKRNSTSSVQVSPALRPKISPSIKPLLPDGVAVSAETSALLLASKSNYQNILEGNHLPGVSYPEALSTNLTSKRTSHKIAEQGRRNRINNALQEIASLLPPSSGRDSSSSGGEANAGGTSTAAQQSNSKASTVEMAIDYIKALQSELAETKGKLEVVEKKLEEKA